MRRLWKLEAIAIVGGEDNSADLLFICTVLLSMFFLVSIVVFLCAEGVKDRKIGDSEAQIYDGAGCGVACGAGCGA
ncbi:hypothetical protein KFK09_017136 [Dendrobium nobile]|uniref:Transmembrane protein n=1 Tax=Dendrobium nobile TaxID=94219 RepID=A0A8T3B0L2_DENNO|nr:hypothetical protein KFK09_017136 [Dendrobium nobile]